MKANILCISNALHQAQLQDMLDRRGIAAEVSVGNTTEALQGELQHRQSWDLILCDWLLYCEHTIACLVKEINETHDASLIFLKNQETNLSPDESYRCGAQDIIDQGNHDHLMVVCQREIRNAQVRKQFQALGRTLDEGDQTKRSQDSVILATIRDMSLPNTPKSNSLSTSPTQPSSGAADNVMALKTNASLSYADICALIKEGGLTLEFQPIVSFRSDDENLRMFETLVRLKDGSGANINPSKFLPIIAQAGEMSRVDLWIFRRALAALEQIQSNGSSDAVLFINLDTQTLQKPDIVKAISTFVLAARIAPGSVVVEIREDAFAQTPQTLESFSAALGAKQHGLLLEAPDIRDHDFLARHRSLLTHVKLDRSLTRLLAKNRAFQRSMEDYVKFAHSLGIHVIALAVEDPQILPLLFQANVDAIQGHFVSMPHESLMYPVIQRIDAPAHSSSFSPLN